MLRRYKGWVFKGGLTPYSNPSVGEYVWVRGKSKETKTGLKTWTFAYAKVLPRSNKQVLVKCDERVKVRFLFNKEVMWVLKERVFLERG